MPWKTGGDGCSQARRAAGKSRQLSVGNTVSNGKHRQGFAPWTGHMWVWGSFTERSMSGAHPEVPRWEDEEEALLCNGGCMRCISLFLPEPPGQPMSRF